MKEESVDWVVYHFIGANGPISIEELSVAADLSGEETERSVRRLEENMLVERRDGQVRVLSFQESLLRCQLRYMDHSLVYIENGIIKVRKS